MPDRVLSRSAVIAAAGVLVACCELMAQQTASSVLAATIKPERAEFGATEALLVRFTLTNTSGTPLNVLKWRTPLEDFTADIFRVERGGKRIDYIGPVVKRGAPTADDYVTIAPGGVVSAAIDLARGYAIYEADKYTVEFNSVLFDFGQQAPAVLAARKTFSPQEMRSNAVTFALSEPRQAPAAPAAEAAPAAKQPVFKNCTATQQTSLNSALTEAARYAAVAVLILKGTSQSNQPNCDRYKTWFGAYLSTRWNTVTTHFDKLLDALNNKTITCNCDCNQSWYAYVYPNNPYEIWFCKAFWNAPLTGTDSRAGTIVHETSHFTVVAGTQDHAYGQANCKNLATNDPAKAVQNADSHEYFAENNPSLKCGLEHGALSLLVVLLGIIGARAVRRAAAKSV